MALTAGVAGLVEPLSDRELQVLGLLAAGRSNQQIADELVVVVVVVLDTVKKHVGHILDKLGAANRTQAVARAGRRGCCARPAPAAGSSFGYRPVAPKDSTPRSTFG